MRLDQELVNRGIAASRSRARDLVLRGHVLLNGTVAAKPALDIGTGDVLTLSLDAPRFVSRGAEKLVAALDAFAFSPCDRIAIDLGASTGGFSEVLLARGAARVYAVDVGHGQIHPSIASDGRVVVLEGTDARSVTRELVGEAIAAITVDLSFISLTKAIGPALALAASDAWLVALVKPQFEVGREAVGKGGIVRDEVARQRAVASVREWIDGQPGWRVTGLVTSPITGGSGNIEYLLGARRDG